MTTRNLTQGPVWKTLFALSSPMTIGIFAVLSVGISDAYFLGQYGQAELAAVGFVYPVTVAVTSLSIGLSAGVNTVVSQAVGDGRDQDARRTVGQGLMFALVLSLVVAGLLSLIYKPLFALIGATGAAADAVHAYVIYWILSFPFLVAMMIANSVVRAYGSSAVPALVMVAVAVINIAINPLLIFGYAGLPEMGAAGAGLATLSARVSGAIAALIYIVWAGYLGRAGFDFSAYFEDIRKITKVGFPAATSNAVNPAGMALITAIVATYGEAAVAGFGAATRVQSLILVPLLALSSGIGPVIGQNWGAGCRDRVHRAVMESFGFCVAYGAAMGLFLILSADWIAQTMSDSAQSQEFAAFYLKVVGISLFGYGVVVVANAANNARGKAEYALGTSIVRVGLIYIPLATVGSWALGYEGIVAAAAATNVMAAYLAVVVCFSTGLLCHGPMLFQAPSRLLAAK